MPTYDFRCPNGHEFEKFYRKISDAPSESPCPQCGAAAERRVSGGAGLLFKGSGFYLTDYGKDAHRKPAPTGPSKDGAAGGEGKGETKPAAGEAAGAPKSGAGESNAESKARPTKGGGAGSTGSSGE